MSAPSSVVQAPDTLRIAINAWFIDQPTTGSGQYLVHLLSEYAQQYSQHRYLLCTHPHHPVPQALLQASPAFEWQVLPTPFDRLHHHLAKLWFEQVTFPQACRRWGASLAHVPYWASPLRTAVPTVVTIHDLIPLLLPAYSGGMLGRLYTRLVARSARYARLVLTDSIASQHDIVHHLGLPERHVKAIHLAADEHFCADLDTLILSKVRDKYRLPEHYLLYLGGFDVRKNVPAILRAYAQLQEESVHLVIAGKLKPQDSAFFPDPRRVANELDILDRVRFTGWVEEEDKPALYAGAVAMLFPSHYEGFGLPPLEAMSCGTPVIVSDRSSLPEIVGEGGLCVDPDRIDQLAGAMAQLVRDPSLRQRKRQTALNRAASFSWSRCAQETMAAYKSVDST